MLNQPEMIRRLQTAFEPRQVELLTELITLSYENLVKVSDFSELKAIVQEGIVAQQNTEKRVHELVVAQQNTEKRMDSLFVVLKELAVAQQNTEKRVDRLSVAMEELAVTQQNTEKRVDSLAVAMEKLTSVVGDIRSEIGGMSRSMSYALENDAYRLLPAFLLDKYGIQITERLVRTYVDEEEINFFGRGVRDGEQVLIVGESKQRLDERRSSGREADRVFDQLEAKAGTVRAAHPDEQMVLLLITHLARDEFLRAAADRGVIVVQSFEW